MLHFSHSQRQFPTVNYVVFFDLREYFPNEVFLFKFFCLNFYTFLMHAYLWHRHFSQFSPLFLICLLPYNSQSSLSYRSIQPCWHFLYLRPNNRPVTYFSQTHSVSLGLSICLTNLTLVHKAIMYHLNTCCRWTVGLGKEWNLSSFDKVVFGWAVHVAVVQLSPGLAWTISILFCMYLQSVTVCAAIYLLDW